MRKLAFTKSRLLNYTSVIYRAAEKTVGSDFGRQCSPIRGIRYAVTALIVAGLLASDVAADPPSPVGPPSARDVPELYLLIRSRRYQEALAEAEQFVKAGQYPAALEALQWILSQSQDVLVRDKSGEFHSARGMAERLLQSLPNSAREQYQRIHGSSAAGEWARQSSPFNTAGCLALVRSYFPTESGYAAAAALVSRWVDDGNVDLAAALALRVLDEPAHRKRTTRAFLRRAEFACRRAGLIAEADRIRTEYLTRVADARNAPPSESSSAAPVAAQSTTSIAWMVPLSRPLWQQPSESAQKLPALAEDWKDWSAEKRDKDQPTAIGSHPVVVRDQVVFRDMETIRALDLETGKPLWHYVTRLGVDQLFNPTMDTRPSNRRPNNWDRSESLFGSSAVGMLTSDGVRVYAANDAESLMIPRRTAELRDLDDAGPHTAVNSLVALNLSAEDSAGRLAWSTAQGVGQPGKPLAGHAFLGPPAVAGGIAYCLAERDRELVLVALDAGNGELFWRQPVALAERPLLDDRPRSLRAAVPTIARGVVLCPTNVGLLVAADAMTGEFRWYHSCLPAITDATRMNFRTVLPPVHKRHSAFAPLVFTSGNRAVYLPTQSDSVYCLDIATGKELWKSSQSDAEFVGGVNEDCVIVVGHTTCRALSLDTGEMQWTARLDSVPAGTGVLLGDGFLLPLDSGQVLALQLKDGAPLGARFSSDRRPIGHLAVSSDVLVAVGGDGATAYPQAGPMLRHIQASQKSVDENPEQSLDLADVYLAQGNLMRALESLEAALSHPVSEPRRGPAEKTLREVYFRLLTDRPERSTEWFERLRPLCRTAPQQSRLLIALSTWHLQNGNREDVLKDGLTLARLTDDVLHPIPHQSSLSVSIPVWVATLNRRVPLMPARPMPSDAVSPRVAEVAFRNTPLGRQAAAHLAHEDRDQGRFHAAEVRWMRNLQQSDEPAAATAACELADLYDAAGLTARAAEMLQLLSTRFAKVETKPGQTGADFVQSWPTDSASKSAWLRHQPIDWPVQLVQMRFAPRPDRTIGDPALKNDVFAWNDSTDGLYGDSQPRRFSPLQADAPYEWLLKSWGNSSAWLLAFDKTSSRPLQSISVPAGAVWPVKEISGTVGSSQTFALPAEIRCVSLMQGATEGIAWTTTSATWTGRTSHPFCGPATPFGAVFQLRNELLVLDPADGRLLWKRDDLESGSGFYADSTIGVLADDRVVFVLGPDKQAYRIYDLATGELMREARFERDQRSGTGLTAVGTLVQHLAETPSGRNLRLWDVATGDMLIDEPVRDRSLVHQLAWEKDIVWLTPEGRLRVFDIATRKVTVDLPLDADMLDQLSSLKAMRQGERYIINLGRGSMPNRTDNSYEPVREPMMPVVVMSGELIAVQPGVDHVLWRAATPNRSFVQWGKVPAPFLVGASVVKARQDNQRRWLAVEAIDLATGLTVGHGDQLPESRLYHADYDGTNGIVRLIGDRGDIELRFDRAIQRRSALY